MSKPPFKMPQPLEPAAVRLDQWVTGEHATAIPEPALRTERPAGKVARLTHPVKPPLIKSQHAREGGIVAEMLVAAWHPVTLYRLSLGLQDML
jgi:hypothetical protein